MVAIGKEAGAGVDNGTHSVFIGYEAAHTNTYNNANCIVIGGNANPSSNSVSNEITLGDANITRLRIPGIGLDLTSAPPTLANGANNRVVTASSASALNGESGLTYNGQKLVINTATAEGSAIKLYDTTANSQVWYVNGEGNSFQGHIYPRTDSNLDLGYHATNKWRDVVISGGIRYGNASDANYLDDYEEGSWTPTINVGTFSVFVTCKYVKIGRFVKLNGGLIFNNNSSNTEVQISNIPFAGDGSQFTGTVWLRRTSTGDKKYISTIGQSGNSTISYQHDSNGNDMGGAVFYSNFQHSSTYNNFSISYFTNA